jgi:hypothetical protein
MTPSFITRKRHQTRDGSVLCDRNLTTHTLTGRIAAAHAHLLGRCKANRKLPLVGRLHDGSYLSVLGGVTVCVIDAEITIATRAGRASSSYRLATTLNRCPRLAGDHPGHPVPPALGDRDCLS